MTHLFHSYTTKWRDGTCRQQSSEVSIVSQLVPFVIYLINLLLEIYRFIVTTFEMFGQGNKKIVQPNLIGQLWVFTILCPVFLWLLIRKVDLMTFLLSIQHRQSNIYETVVPSLEFLSQTRNLSHFDIYISIRYNETCLCSCASVSQFRKLKCRK